MVGLLTLLSLLSATNSSIIGAWVTGVKKVFGWGVFLLPLVLVILGLWLILRNFERVPLFSLERVIGFSLLFLNLLVVLHIFTIGEARVPNLLPATDGAGGGYLGGAALTLMYKGLGWGGSAIAILAWLIIALMLSLDRSILEMFAWTSPLNESLKKIEIPAKILLMMSPERIKRLGYEIPSSEFSHSRFVPSADKYGKLIEQTKKIPSEILEKCFAFGSVDDIISKIEEYIKIGNCRYFILCPYIMPDAKLFLDEVSEKILPHFK